MRIKIRPSDKWYSKYIREKADNICARCHKEAESIQNSHFWGRGNESTRFNDDNCDALCFKCHQDLGANPGDFRDWKLKQLGTRRYTILELLKNTYKKRDDKLDLIYAKGLYENLMKEKYGKAYTEKNN